MKIRALKLFFFLGFVLISFCFLLPVSVHAYLDPGTGSYIFQLLIAGLIGAAFAAKMYWKKIKNFMASTFSKKRQSQEENE